MIMFQNLKDQQIQRVQNYYLSKAQAVQPFHLVLSLLNLSFSHLTFILFSDREMLSGKCFVNYPPLLLIKLRFRSKPTKLNIYVFCKGFTKKNWELAMKAEVAGMLTSLIWTATVHDDECGSALVHPVSAPLYVASRWRRGKVRPTIRCSQRRALYG